MTERGFDDAARALAGAGSRRGLLRGLIGGALAAGLSVFGARRAAAGTRPGPGAACFKKGRRCRYDMQCCTRNRRSGECR